MRLYYKIKNKIKSTFISHVRIPSYETKRAILIEYKERYGLNTLVETGTFFGDTVEFSKHTFTKVISIELSEDLAKNAKKRFEQDKNVTIIHGDSGQLLKDIIKNESSPILFWLDGHYSSEFYVGDIFIKTARTNVDTPIVEELKAILSSKLNHVILIDDARLFIGLNDYPSIYQVKRLVKKSGKKYNVVVVQDIIRLTPIQ